MSLAEALRAADLVVVGAGLFGLTIAERAAAASGLQVAVLERRTHIGGNAWSEIDAAHGHRSASLRLAPVPLQQRGDLELCSAVCRFHGLPAPRVHAMSAAGSSPLPINLGTICAFFGRRSRRPRRAALVARAGRRNSSGRAPRNLEEKAISLIGRPLYEAFIRGYTAKQWQTDPRELPAGHHRPPAGSLRLQRALLRGSFRGIAADGYGALFGRMTAHARIEVCIGVDFFDMRASMPRDKQVVYTGPIDRYFGFTAGRLAGGRSISQAEIHDTQDYQGCAVMNYADERVPYTRVHEFRHLHPERAHGQRTIIYPRVTAASPLAPTSPTTRSRQRRTGDSFGVPREGGARAQRHLRRPARVLPVSRHAPGDRRRAPLLVPAAWSPFSRSGDRSSLEAA